MVGTCLSDIDLEVFHAGDLSADVAARVTGHIESCGHCREQYDRFLDDQGVLGRMRRAAREVGTDMPSSFLAAQIPPLLLAEPPSIRGYDIKREIQRGGQGVVFEAVQLATRRTVALKILLEDPFADAVRRRQRFAAEVELAASLRHPNIVTIHDSGLAEGRFFYVMEYIQGQRLGDYLKSQDLDVSQRLQLFEPICDALAYAHRRGVIHRDLKPSNIRVNQHGVPCLLDFGLACRVDGPGGLGGSQAAPDAEFLGTLAYAAPEQLAGDGEAADTRSDVHGLGVLLYEMLAGRLPYNVSGAPREVIHSIRTATPPSLRSAGVDRDLEAIAFKALAKSPAQRYRSASDFHDDICRYLRGEPVEARRQDLTYVVGRWVRRHRIPVAAACALAGLLVLLGGWHLQAVRRERDQQKIQRRSAEHIQFFLEDILAAAPDAEDVDHTALREMLQHASRRAQLQLGDDPLGQAAVRATIGQTYRKLGDFAQAEEHLQAALQLFREQLGPDDPRVAETLDNLGQLRRDQRRLDEAEDLTRQAIAIMERGAAGPRELAPHWVNLALILWMRQDYETAEKLYQQSLLFLDDPTLLADTLRSYATLLETLGQREESEARYQQALDIYRSYDVPVFNIAAVLANLAELRKGAGDLVEAEALNREALALVEKRLGRSSARAAQIMSNLAALLALAGRPDEAAALAEEALEVRRKIFGEDNPVLGLTLNVLAGVQQQRGDLQLAAQTYSQALAILRAHLGPQDLDVASTLANLAGVHYRQGDYDAAQLEWQETLSIQQAVLGESHADVATTLNNLGLASLKLGNKLQAHLHLQSALEMRRALLGDSHPDVAETLVNLALYNRETGNLLHAETLYLQALDIQRAALPEGHPDIAGTLNNLGLVLRRLGRPKEALQRYEEALDVYEAGQPPAVLNLAATLENIGYLLRQEGDAGAAESRYREALALRAQGGADGGVAVALAQRGLAEAIMDQVPAEDSASIFAGAKTAGSPPLAEAEDLLLASFETLRRAVGTADARTSQTIKALVRLYEMAQRPDDAAPYREMLAEKEGSRSE
jgi:tetratricopeptide (TPR) repeat protein